MLRRQSRGRLRARVHAEQRVVLPLPPMGWERKTADHRNAGRLSGTDGEKQLDRALGRKKKKPAASAGFWSPTLGPESRERTGSLCRGPLRSITSITHHLQTLFYSFFHVSHFQESPLPWQGCSHQETGLTTPQKRFFGSVMAAWGGDGSSAGMHIVRNSPSIDRARPTISTRRWNDLRHDGFDGRRPGRRCPGQCP